MSQTLNPSPSSTPRKTVLLRATLLVFCVVTGIILFLLRDPAPAFPVVGTLSKQDVKEITRAVRRSALVPPLLPDWSVASFRALPDAIRKRWRVRAPKIHMVEQRTHVFVAVISGPVQRKAKEDARILWCVFRTRKGWKVEWMFSPY